MVRLLIQLVKKQEMVLKQINSDFTTMFHSDDYKNGETYVSLMNRNLNVFVALD